MAKRKKRQDPTFYLLTLGCPKNVFDSEGISEMLLQADYNSVDDPHRADVLIVISVLTFLFINFMTMMKTKKWTGIQGTLLGGLTFLALMYLPGMVYTKSMVKDQFWWWWVVHLWVEGAWEIIAGALLAFMLMKHQ